MTTCGARHVMDDELQRRPRASGAASGSRSDGDRRSRRRLSPCLPATTVPAEARGAPYSVPLLRRSHRAEQSPRRQGDRGGAVRWCDGTGVLDGLAWAQPAETAVALPRCTTPAPACPGSRHGANPRSALLAVACRPLADTPRFIYERTPGVPACVCAHEMRPVRAAMPSPPTPFFRTTHPQSHTHARSSQVALRQRPCGAGRALRPAGGGDRCRQLARRAVRGTYTIRRHTRSMKAGRRALEDANVTMIASWPKAVAVRRYALRYAARQRR
ncbi:uncharacterized protein V1518DRAFT_183659 [Limtongia smithiae]|uniref:uncharacterized protein n=1 Tax=Limtongia smithiae TaxID=1125753 RepID=UPI0034CF2B12